MNTLQFTGGELISQDYLESLVIEVRQAIQRHQQKCYTADSDASSTLRIGRLVTQFRLPLETMTALVKTHFPDEKTMFGLSSTSISSSSSSSHDKDKKSSKKKKKDKFTHTDTTPSPSTNTNSNSNAHNDISSANTLQRETAKAGIYGLCLGALRPVPLTDLLGPVPFGGGGEAGVLSLLEELTCPPAGDSSSALCLPGVYNNKEYIPHVFSNQQRIQVDDYFRTNNLISFAYLQSLYVPNKHLEYIRASFQNAIALDSCVISSSLQDVFVSSIEEVTTAYPFAKESAGGGGAGADGNVCPPWLNTASALPNALTELDVEALLKNCGSDLNSKSW
jgi:hypothetical protein